MGLDDVDVLYSHRVDPDPRLDEAMGARDPGVRQGKAIDVGGSRQASAENALLMA
jgi:aryl-alcohol dehydrogenase-like predicted oxidoreductase